MNRSKSSQLPRFYKKSIVDRQSIISDWVVHPVENSFGTSLSVEMADSMVENVVSVYGLPFGIATNFLINGRDYLVPMVIEEPSVIAAASNAAKLFRVGGGFSASSDGPVMIGQVQILGLSDLDTGSRRILENKSELLALANQVGGSIVRRGGGARDIEVRSFPVTRVGPMLIVHLLMDTRDAMGANIVNATVEHIAPEIERLTGGRTHLRILSNLSDHRKAKAWGRIPASELAREDISGVEIVRSIVEAAVFAEVDPYRAATHNKGVMNGIDAVVLATGNDWRAIEAGAHAFVARSGSYTSLSRYEQTAEGDLYAEIELPLAVGIVGGATRVHPTAQLALRILNVQTARELAEVIACVGLAQNFAALRALATEGIQRGHMRLHARQLALAAGATVEQVNEIANLMIDESNIRLERAQQLVNSAKEQQ
ncbi:MAG: hydroxymethylglutaryl-CoA reductase, degradative [Chloroflexi bacterium]|nr:hydroxymethylglutaryl-CoA reductase, degradative [Chloroflexota bacterium]